MERVAARAVKLWTVSQWIRHLLYEICCGKLKPVSQVKIGCMERKRLLFRGFWGGKERFRAQDVNPVIGINEFRNVDVAGGGYKGIGVIFGEGRKRRVFGSLFGVGEERDHVADGDLSGFGEIRIETHFDVVGGGFGAGPAEFLAGGGAFVNDELEGAGEEGFEGGDVDFAVALAGVAIAGFEEGSGGPDGVEDGGAGDKVFVIHVSAVDPGRSGVVAAGGLWRGDADGAEEGMERDGDVGGELGDHALAVKGDDFGVGVGEVFGEEAVAFAETVASKGGIEGDLLDADFEDVAGLGFGDGDGAGEDVAAGAALVFGDVRVKLAEPGGDVFGLDALSSEALGITAGGGGLHDDGVAGVDGEDGLGVEVVEAPGDGGWGGEKGFSFGGLSGCGYGGDAEGCGEELC